jgi:hypothetical protein
VDGSNNEEKASSSMRRRWRIVAEGGKLGMAVTMSSDNVRRYGIWSEADDHDYVLVS